MTTLCRLLFPKKLDNATQGLGYDILTADDLF